MADGTSKAAVDYLSKWLAVELAKDDITSSAVAPGKIVKDAARPVAQYSYDRTPCPRLGEPEDVASCVCFLASDDATQYMTGGTVMIDGGWMAA